MLLPFVREFFSAVGLETVVLPVFMGWEMGV